jgi:cobalt-zinc-cadmium efflux system membrane fusion protein
MILFVLPVLYGWLHRRSERPVAELGRRWAPRAAVWAALCLVGSLSACQGKDEAQTPHTSADRPAIVRINAKAQQEITSQTAESRPLSNELVVQGRIQYSPDRYVKISSPLNGVVREVHGKLGHAVKQDESLLTLESPDIITAYAQLTRAEADRDLARRSHAMAADLYQVKALPKKELEQAENDLKRTEAEYQRIRERLLVLKVPERELDQPPTQRKITGRFELKSSLDGIIVEKNVSVGQLIDQNEALYTVANLDVMEAIGDIYERDLRLVIPGLPVSIAVDSLPEDRFHGIVRHVGDVVDPTSRTIKIRCDVENPDHALKVDLFARIIVELAAHDAVLAIPRKAVIQLADKAFVFVRRAPEEFERREVTLGPASGDLIEIRQGLRQGEQIAVTGTLLLEGELEKQVT